MIAYKIFRLGLCCIFMVQSTAAMAILPNTGDSLPAPRLFTVANVIMDAANPHAATVTFFESARYYQLLRSNKQFATALRRLQQAKKNRQPVNVYLTQAHGDIIEKVTNPIKKKK